jgi:hypothetical protein
MFGGWNCERILLNCNGEVLQEEPVNSVCLGTKPLKDY